MQSPGPLDKLHDGAITAHRFTPYLRDYRLDVRRWAEGEDGAEYSYLFAHCVFAETTSLIGPDTWRASWDSPTDLQDWSESDAVGFAWGVEAADVDTAAEVPNSPRARDWSERLGLSMREVVIETNVFRLALVFSELRIETAGSTHATG